MKTKVSRVLVMLEYEPDNPNNGEVYDLTALLTDIALRPDGGYSPHLSLCVNGTKSYDHNRPNTVELEISWGGSLGGEWVHSAPHLADVINSSMQDGERVSDLRRKAKRLRKKADEIDHDAMVAKLQQVAEVRHLNPIARVSVALPEIPVLTPKPPPC